ncbi:X-box-binding protein 1 [Varanus komodoensis]|uniref:X-box-binding protein 1 n=1 Tax=Varanus komodoensis TaxID=61221 RepID=A0A8D2IT29_VARKO|nr:X-box-binding protein 1 [Varanus komodoensis]
MAPLPGPAAPPRLLLLPASAAQASAPPPGPASTTASPPRKRQRLAHLSPEEKALRRKLKNRVAAQSARDRKKARMGELERQAVEMEAQNQKLLAENRLLRERTHRLAAENQELRLRLGLPALEGGAHVVAAEASLKVEMQEPSEEEEEEEDSRSSSIETATGSAESAVLRLRVPLQQGQAQQSSALVVAASTWIQMASILQILSLISSWAYWTAWIQTCSCATVALSQPAWRSCSRWCAEEKQPPYQPPPVPLWGPHHPSWRPLMN